LLISGFNLFATETLSHREKFITLCLRISVANFNFVGYILLEKQKIVLKKIGKNKDIIKIQFIESIHHKILHSYLTAAISKCFKNDFYKILLDMTNVDEPTVKFVATLIEATAKVRTKNGDIKLINISSQAKQMILSFNAYAYLSVKT